MTEPRFILRTRGSRINPAIRASPVTSRSRAIPETAQFVTERTKRDCDDRSREERSDARSVKGVALHGAHEVLRVADAALYELSEDAVLSTDEEGKFPVFDPAGAAFRVATSSLQGIAKLGTILCPA